jgi:hypothetical protein
MYHESNFQEKSARLLLCLQANNSDYWRSKFYFLTKSWSKNYLLLEEVVECSCENKNINYIKSHKFIALQRIFEWRQIIITSP